MRSKWIPLLIGGAVLYLLFLGWAMGNLSYDTWGAFIVLPMMVGVTRLVLRRIFTKRMRYMYPMALAGLGAKVVGSLVRYWVTFDAYGGQADARLYHDIAKVIAGDIRDGRVSLLSAIPHSTGTQFLEQLAGLVYAIFGSSRLAGFLLFGWMGYWGAVLFLRAALLAIPRLKTRRYASLVFFAPSLMYWPSSLGKEAWMMLCLGLASYGAARLLTGWGGGWSVPFTVLGIVGAGFPRPHFALIWAGALVCALLVLVVIGTGTDSSRLTAAVLFGISVVGLVILIGITLKFLDPRGNQAGDVGLSDRVASILEQTAQNSQQGGSAITPVSLNGPLDWPYAIGRTLTRPLLLEVRSFGELLPALEMTALMGLALVSWRRILNLGHVLRHNPYVVLSVLVVLTFGVSFANISNLGILSRQRSLVLPMLFVPLCLPHRRSSEQRLDGAIHR
ncbi:unannotated protein [freshwater metagenome]|uniref:Unannotated protein n=1 Tax=freshwater metagenome TaxID=449393 RepID=A0A6J7D6M4_9ZZZZ|nr:hypothetical protein [Actinomycetota bacterium]